MSDSIDWRESLGKLLDGSLPEGDDIPVPDDIPEKKPRKRLDITVDRHRKGRVATIISGFDTDDDEIARIAADLRRKLGTGGSSRGGEILIQGDRAKDVQKALADMEYKSRII
ncbi:MAG: translation initiation factor [Muribaculaceae bacterium]|nr:translation initiation factor [Muribaculaceae bacterium]